MIKQTKKGGANDWGRGGKTAWRSLASNRVFSALNVFGLAAGMAVALMIGLWIMLLTKDFLIVVGLSCFIAVPIAWLLLHTWLQQYYYRISIGPGVFVLAAGIVFILTIFTVSVQAGRAALKNPVDSLRAE